MFEFEFPTGTGTVRDLTNKLMQCEDDIERLRAALHLVLKDPRWSLEHLRQIWTLHTALVIPIDLDPLRSVGGSLTEPITWRLIRANCRYSFLLLPHVSDDRLYFLSRLNSICKKS